MKILPVDDLRDAINTLCYRDAQYEKWFVEKDYIISIVLEEITKIDDSIIFKGGTSLSKMRGLLNRFSEDIDLSYCEKLTDGVHRKRNKNLFEKLKESLKKYPQFNFSIDKSENSLTGHVLFKFEIKYSSCIGDEQQNKVIIEIYWDKNNLNKYEYLQTMTLLNKLDHSIFEEYEIKTMCLEDTFVDKVMCLCKIHNSNAISRDTKKVRHLYDLIYLSEEIKFNDELKKKFFDGTKNVYATEKGINIKFDVLDELTQIIKTDYYKAEYLNNLEKMVYDRKSFKSYEQAMKNIENILKFLSK